MEDRKVSALHKILLKFGCKDIDDLENIFSEFDFTNFAENCNGVPNKTQNEKFQKYSNDLLKEYKKYIEVKILIDQNKFTSSEKLLDAIFKRDNHETKIKSLVSEMNVIIIEICQTKTEKPNYTDRSARNGSISIRPQFL